MKARQTFIFLCSVLIVLMLGCLLFPRNGVKIGGFVLEFPTLTEVMSRGKTDTETAEEKLQRAAEQLRLQIEQDSIARVCEAERADSLAYADTLKSYRKLVHRSVGRIECPEENLSVLFDVFDALDACRNSKQRLHILHYGDSQIEQDRITSYIRERLQMKFGGWGAGLVPAIQPIPTISVGQTSSDSLPRYIADGTLRQKLSHNRYGVLAQMAELDGAVTLSFNARDWKKTFSRVKKFSRISLLVGKTSEDFSATIRGAGIDSTQKVVSPSEELSVINWQLNDYTTSFSLQLKGKAEIYGVSMESPCGIFMDNIPLRGSSGTFFTRLSRSLLSRSAEALNVRLILMEFGGNATPYLNSDDMVEGYKNNISAQIRYMQKAFPKARVMVVGPADMSTMIGGELQTYPFLESVIEAMRDAALENGAMFWNMYEVMGGRNSMQKWVDHVPAWAAKDYIHFTETGANRIAEVFVQSFMNNYDYYQFLKRNSKWSDLKN